MRTAHYAWFLLTALALSACGGGSTGSTNPTPPTPATPTPSSSPSTTPSTSPSPAASATPTPTPKPTASPTATPAPTPTPTAAPTSTPAPAPVKDSSASPTYLSEDSNSIIGNASGQTVPAQTSTNTAFEGMTCNASNAPIATHIHSHLSVFVNGQQVAVPPGIGIYKPTLVFSKYFYDASANGCTYDLHTHAYQGVIHVESPQANAVFTLKQFLDLWGVTLSANGFNGNAGQTRLFVTDESTGTPGSYTVTEIPNANASLVTLKSHEEITIEVGPSFVAIPNYSYSSGSGQLTP